MSFLILKQMHNQNKKCASAHPAEHFYIIGTKFPII